MSLLRGMKIFTVHIPSGKPDAQEHAVFLREGFNWMAFFFGAFWALYHRLWAPALGMLAFNGMLMAFVNERVISSDAAAVIQLGFQLFVGFQANDWLRAKFSQRGYIMADVTAADSLLRAEQRYFERVLHPIH